MHEHKINRRRFFNGLLLGGIALMNAPRSLAQTANRPDAFSDARSLLLEPIRSRDSASVIGRTYLNQVAGPVDAADLCAELLESLELSEDDIASMSVQEIHRRLRDRVRADFGDQLTVNLDGWILSHTEARISALIALS